MKLRSLTIKNFRSIVVVQHGNDTLDSYKSKQMLKTIRSSGAFQFHDSTELDNPFESSSMMDLIGEIAKMDRDRLLKDRDRLSKTIAGVAEKHQKGISDRL